MCANARHMHAGFLTERNFLKATAQHFVATGKSCTKIDEILVIQQQIHMSPLLPGSVYLTFFLSFRKGAYPID